MFDFEVTLNVAVSISMIAIICQSKQRKGNWKKTQRHLTDLNSQQHHFTTATENRGIEGSGSSNTETGAGGDEEDPTDGNS